MKYRLILTLALVLGSLVFGLGAAHPVHAATAAQLTATDLNNLQQVLNVTKVTLDAIQVEVNHNVVQDPAAMIVTLNGIKGYLLTIRGILGGSPVAVVPHTPVVAAQPSAPQAVGSGVAANLAPTTPNVAAQPATQNQQTASVSSSATSKWAFWIILIVAVVLAIVLAMPRRKSAPVAEAPTISAPAVAVEEPQTIQSA